MFSVSWRTCTNRGLNIPDRLHDQKWAKPTEKYYLLPTEGAAEAAVIGSTSQAAGTEDVVALQ